MFSNSDEAKRLCFAAKEIAENARYDIKTLLSDRARLVNLARALSEKIKNNLAKASNQAQFPEKEYQTFIDAFDAGVGGQLYGESELNDLLLALLEIKSFGLFFAKVNKQNLGFGCLTLLYYFAAAGSGLAWAIIDVARPRVSKLIIKNKQDHQEQVIPIKLQLLLADIKAISGQPSVWSDPVVCKTQTLRCLDLVAHTYHDSEKNFADVHSKAASIGRVSAHSASILLDVSNGEEPKQGDLLFCDNQFSLSSAWQLISARIYGQFGDQFYVDKVSADITTLETIGLDCWLAVLSPKTIRDQKLVELKTHFDSLKGTLKSAIAQQALFSHAGDHSFSYYFGKLLLVSLASVIAQENLWKKLDANTRNNAEKDLKAFVLSGKAERSSIEIEETERLMFSYRVNRIKDLKAQEDLVQLFNQSAERIIFCLYQMLTFGYPEISCKSYIDNIVEYIDDELEPEDDLRLLELLLSYFASLFPGLANKLAEIRFSGRFSLNVYARLILSLTKKVALVRESQLLVKQEQVLPDKKSNGLLSKLTSNLSSERSGRILPDLCPLNIDDEKIREQLESIYLQFYGLSVALDTLENYLQDQSEQDGLRRLIYEFVAEIKKEITRVILLQQKARKYGERGGQFATVLKQLVESSSKSTSYEPNLLSQQNVINSIIRVPHSDTVPGLYYIINKLMSEVNALLSYLYTKNNFSDGLMILVNAFMLPTMQRNKFSAEEYVKNIASLLQESHDELNIVDDSEHSEQSTVESQRPLSHQSVVADINPINAIIDADNFIMSYESRAALAACKNSLSVIDQLAVVYENTRYSFSEAFLKEASDILIAAPIAYDVEMATSLANWISMVESMGVKSKPVEGASDMTCKADSHVVFSTASFGFYGSGQRGYFSQQDNTDLYTEWLSDIGNEKTNQNSHSIAEPEAYYF